MSKLLCILEAMLREGRAYNSQIQTPKRKRWEQFAAAHLIENLVHHLGEVEAVWTMSTPAGPSLRMATRKAADSSTAMASCRRSTQPRTGVAPSVANRIGG